MRKSVGLKLLSLFLALVLVCQILPLNVWAEEAAERIQNRVTLYLSELA